MTMRISMHAYTAVVVGSLVAVGGYLLGEQVAWHRGLREGKRQELVIHVAHVAHLLSYLRSGERPMPEIIDRIENRLDQLVSSVGDEGRYEQYPAAEQLRLEYVKFYRMFYPCQLHAGASDSHAATRTGHVAERANSFLDSIPQREYASYAEFEARMKDPRY